MSVVAVIPARMGSKRLPAKVVADVGGEPLFVHVASRVLASKAVDRLIVATDSDRVADLAQAAGLEIFRSRIPHETGSDRVAEAVQGISADLVLNVQADNVYMEPDIVAAVVRCFDDPGIRVATPICRFPKDQDPCDSSRVKVVVDRRGRALYFSRQPIPHGGPWWLHVGVYGFRPSTLASFASWQRGSIESAENLEQLRFLENDVAIHVTQVAYSGVSIDTPADMARLPSSSLFPASQSSLRF